MVPHSVQPAPMKPCHTISSGVLLGPTSNSQSSPSSLASVAENAALPRCVESLAQCRFLALIQLHSFSWLKI